MTVCGQLFNRTPSQQKTSTKPCSSEVVHVEQVWYLFDKRYSEPKILSIKRTDLARYWWTDMYTDEERGMGTTSELPGRWRSLGSNLNITAICHCCQELRVTHLFIPSHSVHLTHRSTKRLCNPVCQNQIDHFSFHYVPALVSVTTSPKFCNIPTQKSTHCRLNAFITIYWTPQA